MMEPRDEDEPDERDSLLSGSASKKPKRGFTLPSRFGVPRRKAGRATNKKVPVKAKLGGSGGGSCGSLKWPLLCVLVVVAVAKLHGSSSATADDSQGLATELEATAEAIADPESSAPQEAPADDVGGWTGADRASWAAKGGAASRPLLPLPSPPPQPAPSPQNGTDGRAQYFTPIVDKLSASLDSQHETYRLAVQLDMDKARNVYTIFGAKPDNLWLPPAFQERNLPPIISDCYSTSPGICAHMPVRADTLYQQAPAPFGTHLGGVIPELLKLQPDVAFDSWLTVGFTNGGDSASKSAQQKDSAMHTWFSWCH
jgi:hypothetical protein